MWYNLFYFACSDLAHDDRCCDGEHEQQLDPDLQPLLAYLAHEPVDLITPLTRRSGPASAKRASVCIHLYSGQATVMMRPSIIGPRRTDQP
jgi:hypothetical protein